jgi:fluoroacetyl-CoA thioesterase
MAEPEIGSIATAELVVQERDLASRVGIDDADEFPEVFSTSRLVALMEIAAGRLLRPYLNDGEASVGVTVDIVHTAATPVGSTVIATATYVGRDGKHFLFEVLAADDGGEIGRGRHRRAIVSTSRLVAGAMKRIRE